MRGWLFGGTAALLFAGCGHVSNSDGASPDAGSGAGGAEAGAGAAEAGAGAAEAGAAGVSGSTDDAGAAGEAGAAAVELTLNVVESAPNGTWRPATAARVVIEGTTGSWQAKPDAQGHVSVTVDAHTGPWNVTAAEVNHTVTSVLGVTGPIAGALHLTSFVPDTRTPDVHTLSGELSGLIGCVPDGFNFAGPDISGATPDWVQGTYSAAFSDWGDARPLRVMAFESDLDSGALINAKWLNIPRSGKDVTQDIAMPSPPRPVKHTLMTLVIPSTGAVGSEGLTPSFDPPTRLEDGSSFRVGQSTLTPAASGKGRFAWKLDAFDGDMAPTYVTTTLSDSTSQSLVIAQVLPKAGAVIEVPAAARLDAAGTTFDTLSLRWSAPAYAHVGASLVSSTLGSGWFVYSFSAGDEQPQKWPHLPKGVTLGGVGLSDDPNLMLNVFGLTEPDGSAPWDWGAEQPELAVLRRYWPFASNGEPDAGATPAPTQTPADSAPLSCSMNGIYALDSYTVNPDGCAMEGASTSPALQPPLFIAQRTPWGMFVASCTNADDCHAQVQNYLYSRVITGPWYFLVTPNGDHVDTQSSFFSVYPQPSGACDGSYFAAATATSEAGSKLRITQRALNVPSFTASATNECSSELAKAAVVNPACSSLTVLTGHFVQAL